MTYDHLYAHVQTLNPHIPRRVIQKQVLALRGAERVEIIRTGLLDPLECRGMYFSPQNENHRLVQLFGKHIILVARGLTRSWERVIIIKELMHMLDCADEATDTGEKFDAVLTELTLSSQAGTGNPSIQTKSEFRAMWMALGLFCPAQMRRQLREARDPGGMNDGDIAKSLKLPEVYVPLLFSSFFEERLAECFSEYPSLTPTSA